MYTDKKNILQLAALLRARTASGGLCSVPEAGTSR